MGFFDWISDTASAIGGGIRDIAGGIVGGVEDLGGAVYRGARQAVGGLVEGIGGGLAGEPSVHRVHVGGIADIPGATGTFVGGAIGAGLRSGAEQVLGQVLTTVQTTAHDFLTGGRPQRRVAQNIANPDVGTAGVGRTPQTAQGVPGALVRTYRGGATVSQPGAGALALPGGAAITRQGLAEQVLGPLMGPVVEYGAGQVLRAGRAIASRIAGGETVANGGALVISPQAAGTFYTVENQRVRARRWAIAVNPGTGQLDFWGRLGQPILFSRDFAVCRRVDRLARRARKARRGR